MVRRPYVPPSKNLDNAEFIPSPWIPGKHLLDQHLIDSDVTEFVALSHLRAKGWQDERMDKHFVEQRANAANANAELESLWYKKMEAIFREIDSASHCIPPDGAFTFLDLGCCPGGFASYVLKRNTMAMGHGISLSVPQGGHQCLLDDDLRDRFDLHIADLTYYQLGPSQLRDPKLQDLPISVQQQSFDLVTVDGHHLTHREGIRAWDRDRLLVSQMIIALQAVKPGGNVVIKLGKPEEVRTAKILSMFDTICAELVTCKPRTMHQNRSTFYAICKGMGIGSEDGRWAYFLDHLKKLWVEITFGGDGGCGRYMEEEDLDFVMSKDELVKSYLPRLIELGRDVWKGQADGLRGTLKMRGILERRF